jgi:hypothetical protein
MRFRKRLSAGEMALVSKGQRADISQAERNALKAELSTVAGNYRAGVKARLTKMRERKT